MAGHLKVLEQRLVSNNQFPVGSTPSYNSRDVLKEYLTAQTNLVLLKTQISTATQPIFGIILRMGERKSFVKTLKSMPIGDLEERRVSRRYSAGAPEPQQVEITETQRDLMVAGIEQEISDMQDEIDLFNATTDI